MSSNSPKTLSAADYAVFGITLGVSTAIGLFYAIKDRRSKSGLEGYFLGGRLMGMVPVSLSLAVSYMSAIAVLGIPAEIYRYGTTFWWTSLSLLIATTATAEIFIPVFYRLKLTSVYEYLEKRFNLAVRFLAIILFMISHLLYLGIVIYAPSMSLSAVTGFNLWASIISTGLVCIFYTTLGGFKAVIWTDVFQAIVMLIGFLAITIQGSIKVGGYGRVWEICEKGGRINFSSMEYDPHYRYTFLSIIAGSPISWLFTYGVGQSQVQRYLSCKSLRQAKGSVYLNFLWVVIIITLGVINGTILYAFYHDCDPVNDGKISAFDQLIPFMSLNIFQNQPGLTGILVSSVFSGSLSTISSGINAMACVTVKDLVKPWTNWSETKYIWFTKVIVVIFGFLSIGTAYLVSQLGGILQAAISIFGLVGGPVVALFTLGLMFPFANSLGVFIATTSGIIVSSWIFIGSKSYQLPTVFNGKLPVSVNGCQSVINNSTTVLMSTITVLDTTGTTPQSTYSFLETLYSVSPFYYPVIGFVTSMIIGIILSLVSGGWKDRRKVDPSLLYFFFDHWTLSWLPTRFRRFMRCGADVDMPTEECRMQETGNAFRDTNESSYDAYDEQQKDQML